MSQSWSTFYFQCEKISTQSISQRCHEIKFKEKNFPRMEVSSYECFFLHPLDIYYQYIARLTNCFGPIIILSTSDSFIRYIERKKDENWRKRRWKRVCSLSRYSVCKTSCGISPISGKFFRINSLWNYFFSTMVNPWGEKHKLTGSLKNFTSKFSQLINFH